MTGSSLHNKDEPRRKPRDYGIGVEAINQKVRALKQRMISQLGELVIACRADMLPVDVLAGGLLSGRSNDAPVQDVWWKAGAVMFSTQSQKQRARNDCASSCISFGI